MLAGMSRARGRVVALLDADLQHPPELLLQMLPLLDEGYEQVVAQRTRTGDARSRTWLSRGFYRAMNALSEVRLEDGVGDFRVLSRKAVRAVLSLDEHNRFSKGLFAWIGYPTAVVKYDNVARTGGASRWRLGGLVSYGVDGLLSFEVRPMRAVLYFGAFVTAVALVLRLLDPRPRPRRRHRHPGVRDAALHRRRPRRRPARRPRRDRRVPRPHLHRGQAPPPLPGEGQLRRLSPACGIPPPAGFARRLRRLISPAAGFGSGSVGRCSGQSLRRTGRGGASCGHRPWVVAHSGRLRFSLRRACPDPRPQVAARGWMGSRGWPAW